MTIANNNPDLFPCRTLPEDPAQARLVGIYPQAQEGRFMQRVCLPGGRLEGQGWRALAQLARRYTPATPLHLTTRQDIELHDLVAADIPPVQRALQAAWLTSLGACGDTPRNITLCPCSGLAPGSVELMPLVRAIAKALAGIEGVYRLPRKFKVALACGPGCGQPFLNDLALTAVQRDGRWGFRVVIAGSLGPAPATGVVYREWLEPSQAVALAVAAVKVFAVEGDRTNRRKARLRHVRQRVGDETFRTLIDQSLASVLANENPQSPAIDPVPPVQPFAVSRRLFFPHGNLSPDHADAFAQLSDRPDLAVRLSNQHQVILFAPSEDVLAAALRDHAILSAPAAAGEGPIVVACPGKRWCAHAVVATDAIADGLRSALAGVLPAGAVVCISGCPNGCAHSLVADVGLAGRVSEGRDAFDLYLGGGMGRDERLARQAGAKLAPEKVIETIRAAYTPSRPQAGGSDSIPPH
ncbi:MAG: nitrite/sulfite reductase [Planctomycetota bacterium]|nr:nitrite/sulfite reductase [Planctomycetota bacterium]